MGNSLQVFEFEMRRVRFVLEDSEPWFVAKDVCEVLGYSPESLEKIGALVAHVPAEWADRKRITVRSQSGVEQAREILCLSEQGVYFFLARSDKPAALPFQKKIASEILPSIRKHGAYMTPLKIKEALLDPDTIINLALTLKEEQAKAIKLAIKVEEDRPKVLFADSVTASHTSILVGELAKLLRQNGIEMGQNRLFERLREEGYLMKNGSSRNMPTQRSMELELFEVKETTVNRSDGGIDVKKTPKITGGQLFFINKFCGNKAVQV